MQINKVLATWENWGNCNPTFAKLTMPPKIIARSNDGLTNGAFFLSTRSDKKIEFTLKLFSPLSNTYGINRQHEVYIQTKVAELGLAPTLIHVDYDIGFVVSEFIEGKIFNDLSKLPLKSKNLLIEAISSYQAITLDLPEFNYYEHLHRYAENCSNTLIGNDLKQWQEFSVHLKQWQTQQRTLKLTHHDLNPNNIIIADNNLAIIDWEYAGLGAGELDWLAIGEASNSVSTTNQRIIIQISFWLEKLWLLQE
ncbi:thiamine kinase [Sessilibacter sp. MAH1]